MKKEHIAVVILGLFIFGYVLDFVAGPIHLSLDSPFTFLTSAILSQYPFTAVSVVIKTFALSLSFLLIFSFIEKKFFTKGTVLFCAAALLELYSIQQLGSGILIVPIQWILTFSATGLLLLVPTSVFVCLGIFHLLMGKMQERKFRSQP